MFERLKIDLKAACFEATKRALNRLASVYERGDVYAFAIFAASGCEALAFAYGTKSELHRKISQLKAEYPLEQYHYLANLSELLKFYPDANAVEVYAEVNAIEWNNEVDLSEFLDLRVWEILLAVMSDHSRNDQGKLVEDVLLEVLLDLRRSEILSQPAFADDVFLSIQYPDPSVDQVASVLHKSSLVNSPLWHMKMVAGYGCPSPEGD